MFTYLYVIGAVAFGLVLIMQPIILGISAYVGNISRTGKALLWSSLYLSLILDLVHLIEGYDNTSFNPPLIFSIIYVILLISTILAVVNYLKKWIVLVVLIPDLLAYLTLLGDWFLQLTGSSAFGTITYAGGIVMPYFIIISGTTFIVYAIKSGINKKLLLPFLALSLLVGLIVYFNLIPGLGQMVGITFPYILGILGVRDWMPPLLFAVGLTGVGSAYLLYKKDPAISLSVLSLFSGALIFDSVDTTVYLLIPVSAISLLAILSSIQKKEAAFRQ
ncbi:hypothetical protein [Metallosphaera tengchongensis]|nr:hypothetical protein [Metallosphaera tengchongensis]